MIFLLYFSDLSLMKYLPLLIKKFKNKLIDGITLKIGAKYQSLCIESAIFVRVFIRSYEMGIKTIVNQP